MSFATNFWRLLHLAGLWFGAVPAFGVVQPFAFVHLNWVDLAIIVAVIVSIVRGVRVGGVIQVLSYAGFWAGLALGALVAPVVISHVQTGIPKPVLSLVIVVVVASIVGTLGKMLGGKLWHAVRKVRLGGFDAVAGGAVGAVSSLLLAWVMAGLLALVPLAALTSAIHNSTIVAELNRTLPPLPSFWARLRKLTTGTGFPQVFAQVNPVSAPPVAEASPAQVAAASAKVFPSMVKVVGVGCGDIQEGSGFVVAPGLVVTNAHVVAGVAHPTVQDSAGTRFAAVAVEFDPRFDLSIMRVPGLTAPPLVLDPSAVSRGTVAAVVGYPGGGNYSAVSAGIRAHFEAVGRDIYGKGLTMREVYELDAVVIPGNSGGPLVSPGGEVLGVVFSRSVTNSNIGYALASPGVLQRVKAAEAAPIPTGTGTCAG